MRILLISESLSAPGGWATYARTLAEGLRGRGHAVTAWSPENPGFLRRLPSPMAILRWPFRFLGLKSALRRFSPDRIHVTSEPYALLFALLPRKILDRTVLTIHGSYGVRLLRGRLSRLLMRRVLSRCAAFVTVSEYTGRRVGQEIAERLSPALARRFTERTRVIHNAVTLPAGDAGETKISSTPKNILLIGPVKPRKGILEAVEACARYRDRYGSPFLLRIIGTQEDDAYARSVRSRIAELRLTEQVRCEGVLTEESLKAGYRSADLLLLPAKTTPTTFEGFGLVYVEAAGYGVPCIGPDDGGAVEAIAEGVSGYRIRPDDAETIAERMHRILDERRIGPESCRNWAKAFSVDVMAEAMEKLYDASVSGSLRR